MLTEERNKLRDQLVECQSRGTLGVLAARTSVPEWVIRDWCTNSLHTPTLEEMRKLQSALDNKKRDTPNSVPADVGKEPAFP